MPRLSPQKLQPKTPFRFTSRIRTAPPSLLANKSGLCQFLIIKKSGKWYLNTEEGRQEILYRRIGEKELNEYAGNLLLTSH